MYKLIIIKSIHTLIWLFFNAVFFYMVYAVIVNRINIYVWIGVGLFLLEIMVLLLFKSSCPLTLIARKYSHSTEPNFDIYLPKWLAKHNKLIYGGFLFCFLIGLFYRLFNQ